MKKLTFSQAVLKDALHKVGITVAGKPVVPVCDKVNVKSSDGKVILFTSDISASTQISIPYTGDSDVSFNVLYSDLFNFVKLNTGDEVLFVFDAESNRLEVKSNKDKAVITTDQEPHLDRDFNFTGKYNIPFIDVEKIHKNIVPFVSSEGLDGPICGVLIDGNEKVAVGTNKHVLGVWKIPGLPDGEFIVPTRFIKALHQLWVEDLSLDFTDGSALIECGSLKYKTSLIDGKYPDYKSMTAREKSRQHNAVFNTSEFLKITNKSLLFTDVANSIAIFFGATNARIVSGSAIVNREFQALIDCENDLPENYKIGYNANYLHRIVSLMEDETFTISMSEPNSVTFIRDTENVFIIMPIAL